MNNVRSSNTSHKHAKKENTHVSESRQTQTECRPASCSTTGAALSLGLVHAGAVRSSKLAINLQRQHCGRQLGHWVGVGVLGSQYLQTQDDVVSTKQQGTGRSARPGSQANVNEGHPSRCPIFLFARLYRGSMPHRIFLFWQLLLSVQTPCQIHKAAGSKNQLGVRRKAATHAPCTRDLALCSAAAASLSLTQPAHCWAPAAG